MEFNTNIILLFVIFGIIGLYITILNQLLPNIKKNINESKDSLKSDLKYVMNSLTDLHQKINKVLEHNSIKYESSF